MLGKCAKQAEYSYADIIKSLWMIAFTGGQALEDINNQTGSVLKLRPGAHVPNADTIGYAQKKACGQGLHRQNRDTDVQLQQEHQTLQPHNPYNTDTEYVARKQRIRFRL